MLSDGYLSTLQLMKLMRLANILKNKPFTYKNERDPVNTVNLLHFSTKLCLHYEKSFMANDFPRVVTDTKLPAVNPCLFLQLMWDVKNLRSEQTCSSRRYFTHLKWWRQKAPGLGPTHQAGAKGCSARLSRPSVKRQ